MSAPVSRRRWTAAQVALAIGLIAIVLFIGTEAGRLLTSIRAVGALVGAALVVMYLVRAPRAHDVVDILVLGGLALFLITCVTSSIPRLSFEAATSALGYAAAFYVARGAVADARGRDLALVVLGGLGSLLGLFFLVRWGAVWLEWVSSVGGLPPLDLQLPSAPYAGIHVAILAGVLLPATVSIARRRGLWPLGLVGTVSLLALIVMSGSRSVWLGLVAAGLTLAILGGGRAVMRLPRAVLAAGVVAVLGVVLVAGGQLLSRLVTGSTVELRLAIWGESVERWLESPLLGYGPGTFAAQFNLTDYYNRFEPWHTHPHNVVVQVLAEGGLIGLVGGALIAAGLVIGIRRRATIEWAPVAAVAFMAGVGITENPTISAYLVAPLIVWCALAAPRNVEDPAATPRWNLAPVRLALAAATGLAVVSTIVASLAYDRASAAARADDGDAVVASLRQAVAFDPAMPLYRRDLGLWLMTVGARDEARQQVGRALDLNPTDAASLRSWAVLTLAFGDEAGALAAAAEAQRRADLHPENALTLAYVANEIGDTEARDAALLRAVRRYPWVLAAPDWVDVFPDVDKAILLEAARDSWSDPAEYSHRNLRARVWLDAMTGMPPNDELGLAGRTQAALLACELDAAVDMLGELTAGQAADSGALQARLLVWRALGRPDAPEVLALLAWHDPGIVRQASDAIAGAPATGDHNADVAVYARIPIRPPAGPILPTEASGLSAWMRDPVGAADVGAPASGLATCR